METLLFALIMSFPQTYQMQLIQAREAILQIALLSSILALPPMIVFPPMTAPPVVAVVAVVAVVVVVVAAAVVAVETKGLN